MKRSKFIALLTVVLIIGGIAWYQKPIKKQFTLPVCTTEGERVDLIMDVSWHRFLLFPTELRGNITIGDKVYQDCWHITTRDNILERIQGKIEGELETTRFAILGDVLNTGIAFIDVNEDFSCVCVSIFNGKSGSQPIYYGPATNATEVDVILDKISALYQEK